MTPNELKYTPIEKLCLVLISSIQKLKHYFQAHTVRLISNASLIKCVMLKLVSRSSMDHRKLSKGRCTSTVIVLTPQQDLLPYSFSLSHNYSNNVVEYQALILGLEAAIELDIHQLEIYGDSQLVINQLTVARRL
ncbi:hypothetical protein LIER_11813 [Lithospermum erythrorhizon]|uniref:RNase H type-1 domain-containing protein n=1 Tax=Lithospermum erythrorhizon TaxID=34254 RepID=A0AAV3PQU7_LITER